MLHSFTVWLALCTFPETLALLFLSRECEEIFEEMAILSLKYKNDCKLCSTEKKNVCRPCSVLKEIVRTLHRKQDSAGANIAEIERSLWEMKVVALSRLNIDGNALHLWLFCQESK